MFNHGFTIVEHDITMVSPWSTMVKLLRRKQGSTMVDHGKGTC